MALVFSILHCTIFGGPDPTMLSWGALLMAWCMVCDKHAKEEFILSTVRQPRPPWHCDANREDHMTTELDHEEGLCDRSSNWVRLLLELLHTGQSPIWRKSAIFGIRFEKKVWQFWARFLSSNSKVVAEISYFTLPGVSKLKTFKLRLPSTKFNLYLFSTPLGSKGYICLFFKERENNLFTTLLVHY